jgi:molybdopterin converting factor small subunit
MRIKVKYFASIRELFGISEEEYEVERGVKLADLLSTISRAGIHMSPTSGKIRWRVL